MPRLRYDSPEIEQIYRGTLNRSVMDSYTGLPVELHTKIFSYYDVDIEDILSAGQTCKQMAKITQNEDLRPLVSRFDDMDHTCRRKHVSALNVYLRSRAMLQIIKQCIDRINQMETPAVNSTQDLDALAQQLVVFTTHHATFRHVDYGHTLEAVYDHAPDGPLVDFMVQNGASLSQVPCGINELLEGTLFFHSLPLFRIQLLLDHGAEFDRTSAGPKMILIDAVRAIVFAESSSMRELKISYLQLMLTHGVHLSDDGSIAMHEVLELAFIHRGDDQTIVPLLLEHGASWSQMRQPRGRVLEVAYRELRSNRRDEFIQKNVDSIFYCTGVLHDGHSPSGLGNLIRATLHERGLGRYTWRM